MWPLENRIDVAFQDFIDAKAKRNQQSQPVNLLIPYTVNLPNGASITVVGNPDFSAVQGVMLLPASVIAGVLWQGLGRWSGLGPWAPFAFGAAMALAAALWLALWQPARVTPTR